VVRTSVRSFISAYLVLVLTVPPQVWAELGKPAPAVAAAEVPEGSERDKLRLTAHEAGRSAELAVRKLGDGFAASLKRFKTIEYRMVLEPYALCSVPSGQTSKDLEAAVASLDSALNQFQSQLVAFFEKRGNSLIDLSGSEPDEGLEGLPVDVLSAKSDPCVPQVPLSLDSLSASSVGQESTPANWEAALKSRSEDGRIESSGMQFLQPFFVELGRKRSNDLALTDAEARRWIGWLSLLKDFRNAVAKQAGIQTKLPDLILPPGPSQRVGANDVRVAQNRVQELLSAGEMLKATQLSEVLPRFVKCQTMKASCGTEPVGKFAEGSLCYCVGQARDASAKLEDTIHTGLTLAKQAAGGKEVPHGAILNAERLIAIGTILMEVAAAAALLLKQARPENLADLLPDACRSSPELADHVKIFETYSTVEFREWWLLRLQAASAQFSENVRVGKQNISVPKHPKFYAKAESILKEWVEAVYADAASGPKEKTLQMIEAFPFKERLLDAGERSSFSGQNFIADLSRLISVWGTLIPWEFEKLTQAQFEKRDTLISEMLREAYASALTTALQGFGSALFSVDAATHTRSMKLWESKFRSEWDRLLNSRAADAPIAFELDELASAISKDFLSSDAFKEKFSPEETADKALRSYVREAGPRSRDAFISNQIEQFMGAHTYQGPANFFPGMPLINPDNYDYQSKKIKNATEAPAAFQVQDNTGRSKEWYELFISTIHPGQPGDYVGLKRALKSIGLQHVEQLTNRITKTLSKTESKLDEKEAAWVLKEYPKRARRIKGKSLAERAESLLSLLPDEEVTETHRLHADAIAGRYFGAGSGVKSIAGTVIEHWNTTLEAKEVADTGRARESRRSGLGTINEWFASELGRKEFADNRQLQATRIYNYHLRSLLELRTPENAASIDAQITERIKRASPQEAWSAGRTPESATAQVLSSYERFLKMTEAGKLQNSVRAKWEKNHSKHGPFDAWAAFCQKDPDACHAWFKESALLYSTDTLSTYFENRVRRSTADLMKQFLEVYGEGQPLLDLSDPAKIAPNVKLTREKLLSLWVGELRRIDKEGKPISQPRYEEVRPKADALLLSLSKAAHDQKSNALALESLPETMTGLMKDLDLLNAWNTRIKADLAEIEGAILSKDPAQMVEAQGLVLRVLYVETMYLLDASRELNTQNLREELTGEIGYAVLPSFSQVRDQVNAAFTELLVGDSNQIELLGTAEERRVELTDLLWDQKEKKQDGKDPHRSLESELADLERNVIPKLKKQIHRELALGNLLKTYVPESVAQKALQGSSSNLWLSFLNRQFLHTLKDARGEDMALSMSQTIQDLNAVAKKLEAPLPIGTKMAKLFVEEIISYFSVMNSTTASKESFDRFFAKTLSSDRDALGASKKVPPETFAELVKRLERVWVGATGKTDGFNDWLELNKAQSSENFRAPQFVNGLARLSMADAEQWRVIEHAAAQGNSDSAFKALLQFDNGKDLVSALMELKLLWVRVKGSEDGWKEWIVGIARDPETMKQELVDSKPLGDGFPKGTLYLESVLAQAKAILPSLESPKDEKAPRVLEGKTRSDYEALVRLVSDVLYHPGSQLGPWAVSATEVVWPNFPPTASLSSEVTQRAEGIFEFVGGGLDSRFAMESLIKIFSLPGMTSQILGKLISPFILSANEISLPEFANVSEKLDWLNALSSQVRIAVFSSIQDNLTSLVLLSGAVQPEILAAFNASTLPAVSRGEWLINHSILLEAFRGLKPAFVPPPKDVNTSGPDALALRTVRSLLDHTAFRLKEGRWVVAGKEAAPDRNESLEAFRTLLGKDRRRALEALQDLERSFINEVTERKELAFEGLFQLPETPSQMSPLESAVELVVQRFHPAALAQKTIKALAVNAWKRAYLSSSLTGKSPFEAKFVEYKPSWTAGIPSDETAAFSEWVNRLLNNPASEKVFQELKSTKPGLEKHLWEEHPTLKAALESHTIGQIKGLMKVADANSRYSPLEKSYPFFLVLLDEKLSTTASTLDNGAGRLTFTESMRVHFLKELVDILALDRKAFSGWETLLKRRGQPKNFAEMAESKRNLLVGVVDNRFLSTGVTASWTGRNLLGSRQANNSPIPVVSNSERALIALETDEDGSTGNFSKYIEKIHSPEIDALTRMHSDGAFSRPLYQNLLSIQMQMHGEKDVQEAEARLAHLTDSEQIKKLKYRGRRNDKKPVFGSGHSMDANRVRQVEQALKESGVFPIPSETEIKSLGAVREKYVDFKHSLGEMGTYFTAWSIAEKLKAFLTQIDPNIPPKQLSALTQAASNAQVGTTREAALEVAMKFMSSKIYGSQTDEQKKRAGAVLLAVDQTYVEAMQKIEVQEALGVVLKNDQEYLAKLCDPSTVERLESVKTKEDLTDVDTLLKETGIAFSTGLHKYVYFDSGLLENGEGNETRRRVDAIVRKASAYRKTLDTIGLGVNWTVGLGLFAFLFSKPFPGVGALGKVVMRGSAARVGTLGVSGFIAGYFGWEVLDDVFGLESLFGQSNLEMIRKVSETQFKGYSPLRRDKDVGELERKTIADSVESRTSTPYLHAAWNIWMAGVTFSMLSPLLKAASGGVRYAWATRFRFARGLTSDYVDNELARQASKLDLPVKALLTMPESEAALRFKEAETKKSLSWWRTNGKTGKATRDFPEMAQAIFPSQKPGFLPGSRDPASILRQGLDAELKSIAAQNSLNPVTGERLRLVLPGGERQSVQVLSEEALMKRALELRIPPAEIELAGSTGELRGLVAGKEMVRQVQGQWNPKVALEKAVDVLRGRAGVKESLRELQGKWNPKVRLEKAFVNMQKEQDAAVIRFQQIKAIRSKLSGPSAHYMPADLDLWLSTGSDALFLNTPTWTYIAGFPFYTSEATRLLGGLQAGHQRSANRLLAVKWLLKWRNSDTGYGAFREGAKEARCTPLDLFQAAADPKHEHRWMFSSVEKESASFGEVATQEIDPLVRENLIRAANELGLIMELGGWRGDEALLKLLSNRSTVASDRALIKHALTDAYSESAIASSAGENLYSGEALLDSTAEESSAILVGELRTRTPVSVRGVIIPEDIRTEIGILDYVELQLLERRHELPGFKPLSEKDLAFIRERIAAREPEISAILSENSKGSAGNILGRRFRSIDIEEAILRLKETSSGEGQGNLMSPAREKAYRTLVAYVAAYESHGQGAEFDRAVAFFREILDFSGPDTGIQSARLAYDALFGESPLGANGLRDVLRKTNAITGTLGTRPLAQRVGIGRLDRIEGFLKGRIENNTKTRGLARLKQVRNVFNLIAKEDGLQGILKVVRTLSPKDPSAKAWLMPLRLHLPNNLTKTAARTPEALSESVGMLLLPEFSASELDVALMLASKQGAMTPELKEAFRYALAYTRAAERATSESLVSQPELARWYSEIYLNTLELTGTDLPLADAMFSSIVGKVRLREFEEFERALGFVSRPKLNAVQERVRGLKSQFEDLKGRSPGAFDAETSRVTARLDSIQSAFELRGGPDVGFDSAWTEFLAKSSDEAGGVPQLLNDFISGSKTNAEIAKGLVELRLQVIREVAEGSRPAKSIDALNRGTLLIRGKILSKLAASEEVVSTTELETVVRSFYNYSGQPYSGFSTAEAELFVLQTFKHNRNLDLQPASLRKQDVLTQLHIEISTSEWPAGGTDQKLYEAVNTLLAATERTSGFERSLLAIDNPLALGWEQVTQSEFLENSALFHFVMGGSEAKPEGVSILRALLVERPSPELEKAVSLELNQMHRTSINNQIRENEQRTKNGLQQLQRVATGPEEILAGFEARRSWAFTMDQVAETIPLHRAIDRLNAALRGVEWKAPSSDLVQPVIAPAGKPVPKPQ
jgi:hypothetical protein